MLAGSVAGWLLTSLVLRRWPRYDASDAGVLLALGVLMVVTRGLERQGLTAWLAHRLQTGRHAGFRLVFGTLVLSALLTNDVTLLALVPLALRLPSAFTEERVVLMALAANVGSALAPFGNPQNLFLYWHYGVSAAAFLHTVAPLAWLALPLLALALWTDRAGSKAQAAEPDAPALKGGALAFAGLLGLTVVVVLHLLPLPVLGAVVLLAAALDLGSLRVDVGLLATFAAFFGLTDQLRYALQATIAHPQHVFLGAALLSQAIGNVPAALLLADFTADWHALVWGVSVGGFGTLIASLANVIAYRVYARSRPRRARALALKMQLAGAGMWVLGAGLYFAVHGGW